MIGSNTITLAQAEALLMAISPEQRTDMKHD